MNFSANALLFFVAVGAAAVSADKNLRQLVENDNAEVLQHKTLNLKVQQEEEEEKNHMLIPNGVPSQEDAKDKKIAALEKQIDEMVAVMDGKIAVAIKSAEENIRAESAKSSSSNQAALEAAVDAQVVVAIKAATDKINAMEQNFNTAVVSTLGAPIKTVGEERSNADSFNAGGGSLLSLASFEAVRSDTVEGARREVTGSNTRNRMAPNAGPTQRVTQVIQQVEDDAADTSRASRRELTSGGLMQLVAYDAQDLYLTGNPEFSHFKQRYKRHTNYAMQDVEAHFSGSVDFGKRVTLVVPRVGDLMHQVRLRMTIPSLSAPANHLVKWVEDIGHSAIESVEIQIGGQSIDKHSGEWLNVNADLWGQKNSQLYTQMNSLNTFKTSHGREELWVPLQFWFNKHVGSSLPLIALQYHEVTFVFTFKPLEDCVVLADSNKSAVSQSLVDITPTDAMEATAMINYIFLDTDEQSKFSQKNHEYLMEQLQMQTALVQGGTTTVNLNLDFNHPVKFLVFTIQLDKYKTEDEGKQVLNFAAIDEGEDDSSSNNHILESAKLQFDGHDRFQELSSNYFSQVQTDDHFPKCSNMYIYKYSFALNPELVQPSGTANFSEISTASLILKLRTQEAATVNIYAVNYNVLKIESGMGGLAFGN